MIDDDNYEIPVRSMDCVFDVQEGSYEYTTYIEFLEIHSKRLSPLAQDYA